MYFVHFKKLNCVWEVFYPICSQKRQTYIKAEYPCIKSKKYPLGKWKHFFVFSWSLSVRKKCLDIVPKTLERVNIFLEVYKY